MESSIPHQKFMTGLAEIIHQLPPQTILGGLALIIMVSLWIGWLLGKASQIRKVARLEAKATFLSESAEEKEKRFADQFSLLSQQALKQNNIQFLSLAQQVMKQFQLQNQNVHAQKESALSSLIEPLKSTLSETEKHLSVFDRDRRRSEQELHNQLHTMAANQYQLQVETRNLSRALSKPEVRGLWGEINLRRLVEMSGMSEHVDFIEQPSMSQSDRQLRPDMLIKLPENRQVVIDAQTPLDGYLAALESDNETERNAALKRHAQQLVARIRALSHKEYWQLTEDGPEFAVLYLPGDPFLDAAIKHKPDLLEYALERQVVLATPTSLIALLRTIAFSWKQHNLNHHTRQLRKDAAGFYKHLCRFNGRLDDFGKNLEKMVKGYNNMIDGYQKDLIPISVAMQQSGFVEGDEVSKTPQSIETNIHQNIQTNSVTG